MRLDATDLRYITPDEFRILTAVEMGSKNHEVVPTQLIAEISAIRGGSVNKCLGGLAKRNLVARVQNAKYDGYRLTYGGLDYLALRTFSRRKPASVSSVGKKMAVGKEGDIYVVKDDAGDSRVLKMHRLGRISFRAIKTKRDYLGKRKAASWMYMSRLAAQKEFAFLKALYLHGFPVPVPIDQARHCVVMQLVDSYPLRAIESVPDPGELYSKLMNIIVDLALAGLIHGDFNEFNILVRRKTYEPVVIDFPQMVSVRHENAECFFNRDVNCIRRFFRRRFHFEGTTWPLWKDVLAELREQEGEGTTLGDGASGLAAVNEEEEEEEEDEAEGRHGRATSTEEGDGEEAESSTRKLQIVKPDAEEMAVGEVTETAEGRPKRVRIDLEVEASGFGRGLQSELEAYMMEVQDIPESDPEYEDDGEEEEEEEEDDEADEDLESAGQTGETATTATEQEPFDQEAFQAQMTARLEALRLHKALGNDDPSESGTGFDPLNPDYDIPSHAALESDEESYDSDSSTDVSDGVPESDFTAYSRATRGRGGGARGRGGSVFGGGSVMGGSARSSRSASGSASASVSGTGARGRGKKDDLRMAVAKRIEKELGGKGGSGPGGSSKMKATAGKAKGHKWKANPKYLVGSTNDGW